LSMSEGKCLANTRQNETKVSYPNLLTPAFVACSTNVGKPGKLIMCNDVPAWTLGRREEEWHIPRK